jgi:putative transposase
MCKKTELFNNKYRISSTRLSNWDYTDPGIYFVTICTEGQICWFGKVQNKEVIISNIGKIVGQEWKNTGKIRPNVILDKWVIMPNHLHGIIIIKYKYNIKETSQRDVSTGIKSRIWPSSLGSIICQFKSSCTKKIRLMGNKDFQWQKRFYDHIIRNKHELFIIRKYIINNPAIWTEK